MDGRNLEKYLMNCTYKQKIQLIINNICSNLEENEKKKS